MSTPLGPRHPEVRRLRALVRVPRERARQGVFVLEGPRVVASALARGVPLERVYFAPGAGVAFPALVDAVTAAGVSTGELREGVVERVGDTRTPQPVLAVAPIPAFDVASLAGPGPVVVAVELADPGNLGTVLRSAEAAGAAGVVVAGDSVDVHNPKVVRSSAGAVLGVPIVTVADAGAALDVLRAQGRTCLGARPRGGAAPWEAALGRPIALVVGNEARGLPAELASGLDGWISIPMADGPESLNVAMATTVLLFEAARQRCATESGQA